MRILFVSNLYGELARGGAEQVVRQEAEALAAAGHDVVVVSGARRASPGVSSARAFLTRSAYSNTGASSTLALAEETPVVPVAPASGHVRHVTYSPPNICFYSDLGAHGPLFRLIWHVIDIFNYPSALRLKGIIESEKPDVVHTHNLMGLGFMIPSVLRAMRVRHVHTVHDVQLLDPSGLLPAAREFTPGLHQTFYIALMRRMMGSPDAVIFPSEFHKALHERFGFFPRSERVVLRNPAPRAAVAGATTGAAIKNGRSFLFAGQLETHKGIFDLLEAWERAGLTDATLEIAGSGSQAVAVAERVAAMRGVRMLGRLHGAALDAAYDRASWLVLPSRVIENAPSSIMEAAGLGVPTIASASGGIPEVVKEGENGFLFAPGDVPALTSAMGKAARLDVSMRDMFAAAARGSIAGLDAALHVARLAAIYTGTAR